MKIKSHEIREISRYIEKVLNLDFFLDIWNLYGYQVVITPYGNCNLDPVLIFLMHDDEGWNNMLNSLIATMCPSVIKYHLMSRLMYT